MTAPRIEIDLAKVSHNTRQLVEQLGPFGIGVTGVTKAVCGHPGVAGAMLSGGATGLADARISNVGRLRMAGMTCPIAMIRGPMFSQLGEVTRDCDVSYNTEIATITHLAAIARGSGKTHGIILMVEMGDMREGIMPADLTAVARAVFDMTGVTLKGIGANFACMNGEAPTARMMASFSSLATHIESAVGTSLETVSGGSSSNLKWAGHKPEACRVNELRLGEAILLGVDPLSGNRLEGLHTDAFTLIAEIIETKTKTGSGQALVSPNLHRVRSLLAIGKQDTDGAGLAMPEGVVFAGATSDHLVVTMSGPRSSVGSEMRFRPNYSALMRAMNASDVAKVLCGDTTFVKPAPAAFPATWSSAVTDQSVSYPA